MTSRAHTLAAMFIGCEVWCGKTWYVHMQCVSSSGVTTCVVVCLFAVCVHVCLRVCLVVWMCMWWCVCVFDYLLVWVFVVLMFGNRGSCDLIICWYLIWCVRNCRNSVAIVCVVYARAQMIIHIQWLTMCGSFVHMNLHQVQVIRLCNDMSECISCRAVEARMYDAGPPKLAR